METQTFVIKRKISEDGKSRLYYFNDYMLGLPRWGDLNEAKKFSTKKEANKHLPGLRHRRTTFGNHYMKGIKVVEAFKTGNGKFWYIIEKNDKKV